MKRREKFIEGIYRHCDRWCERCQYTEYCMVFHDGEKQIIAARKAGAGKDETQLSLEIVGKNFRKTERLIRRMAKKQGIDLAAVAAEAANQPETLEEVDLDKIPAVKQANDYMLKCRDLLADLREAFNHACDNAQDQASFMEMDDVAEELREVVEAARVLAWDHTMICVKTRSAFRSHTEALAETDEELRDMMLPEADGTASVAYRCLKRSQQALHVVYQWDADLKDAAIDLLVLSEKIVAALVKRIPGCQSYVWPRPSALARLEEIKNHIAAEKRAKARRRKAGK